VDKDGNYIAAAVYANVFHGNEDVRLKEVVKIDRRTGARTVLLKSAIPEYTVSSMGGPWTIALDSSGGVLLAAEELYRLDPSGTVTALPCKDLDVPANPAPCANIRAMTLDREGNLYFSVFRGDRVRRRSSNGDVRTVAGGDPTADERFFEPKAMAMTSTGQLVVLDQGNATVRLVGTDGRIKTLAGGGRAAVQADGVGTAARFAFPQSLTVNAKDQILVSDMSTVRLLSLDGTVKTLAGKAPFFGRVDGQGEAARFDDPQGITLGSAGELYLADGPVRRINLDGLVSTVQSQPELYGVGSLALGPFKSLYMGGSNSISRLNADGTRVPVVNGDTPKTLIEGMEDISADAAGDIYVADTVGLRIRKVSGDGKSVTTLAGLQHVKGSRDGGPDVATFEKAHAAAVDARGNVYVADGSTVRKVSSTGVVSTIGGLAGQATVVDGPAATARFADARRIAVDSAGNVLVLDGTQRLRRIAPDGSVSTVHTGFDLRSFTVLAPGRVAVVDEKAVFLVSFL